MRAAIDHMSDSAKTAVDAVSFGTVLGTIAGWLPSIAALLTIVWTGIRIWETRTVRGLLDRQGHAAEGGRDDV